MKNIKSTQSSDSLKYFICVLVLKYVHSKLVFVILGLDFVFSFSKFVRI